MDDNSIIIHKTSEVNKIVMLIIIFLFIVPNRIVLLSSSVFSLHIIMSFLMLSLF